MEKIDLTPRLSVTLLRPPSGRIFISLHECLNGKLPEYKLTPVVYNNWLTPSTFAEIDQYLDNGAVFLRQDIENILKHLNEIQL